MASSSYRLGICMARFRPPIWATLGTITLGAVLLSAGFWQLRRASEKAALLTAFGAGSSTAALQAAVPDAAAPDLRYRRIALRGRYDPSRQVLLDARILNQRPGYEVLTPLRLGDTAVLVNRGWIAAPATRGQLPEIPVDAERDVLGQIDLLPRAALRAGPGAADSGWPRRLLFPTAAEIAAAVGYPVHDYQLLLDPGQPDGYLRQWRPQLLTPDEHIGYAVQWFALAAALGVIYAALNLKKDQPGPLP
jgi:surfeit locus 1 family protein